MMTKVRGTVYICPKCARTRDRIGQLTTKSAYEAATAHGCIQRLKPKGKKGKTFLKWAVPRVLPSEVWRTVWDSLTGGTTVTVLCRSKRGSCGHAEASHLFSSVTQPFCRLNCARCP